MTVESIQEALSRYLFAGIRPGHCLSAILSNDLVEAVSRADDETLANLHPIVKHLFNQSAQRLLGLG